MRLVIFFVSSLAMAGNYISPESLQKIHDGESGYSVHRNKTACGNDCVDVDGKDPSICVIKDGELVEDAALKSAKETKEKAVADAEAADQAKKDAGKEKLKDLPSANSVTALREQVQAIKDYLGLE